jgi:hypothetical protein
MAPAGLKVRRASHPFKGQNTSSRNEPTTTKNKSDRNNHLFLPVRCDIAPPMQQQKQPTRNNNVNRFILLDGMVIRPVGLRRPTDVMTRVIRHHNNLQDNNLSIQFFFVQFTKFESTLFAMNRHTHTNLFLIQIDC